MWSDKLLAAMAAGDLQAVVALLHPDVTFTGDSGGKAPTAVQVIRGADKVVRFVLGLAATLRPVDVLATSQLALVNGELGRLHGGLPRPPAGIARCCRGSQR